MGSEVAVYTRERAARSKGSLRARADNLRCDFEGVRRRIRNRSAVFAVILMIPVPAFSNEHEQASASLTLAPPISITINPEARVSVTLGGALPPPVACGKPVALPVKIINQGFVASR